MSLKEKMQAENVKMTKCYVVRCISTMMMVPLLSMLVLLSYIPMMKILAPSASELGLTSLSSTLFSSSDENESNGLQSTHPHESASVRTSDEVIEPGRISGFSTVLRLFILIIFHFLLYLMIASYFLVWYINPGEVPEDWQESIAKFDAIVMEIEKTARFRQNNAPVYPICKRSGKYKPPRSHFDSVSGKLVLNFDHFCPWVANTVGFYNKKFFVLFVTYAWVNCVYCAIVLYFTIMKKFLVLRPDLVVYSRHVSNEINILGLIALIVDLVFAIVLLFFGGFHWYMVLKNQTTIEGYDRSKNYDLGYRKNMEMVFGKNKWHWFLPIVSNGPGGDGVHWETVHGNIDGALPDGSAIISMMTETQNGEKNDIENGLDNNGTEMTRRVNILVHQ